MVDRPALAALPRGCGLCAGIGTFVAPFDLCPAAACLEVGGGFCAGGLTDLNVVRNGHSAAKPRQSGGHTFVLDYVGFALNRSDTALYVNLKFLNADFRFGKSGADVFFYVCVGSRRGGLG